MKIADATPHLIQKWLKRPENERTENDILKFYSELESQSSPYISFSCSGDKYQKLKSILKKHTSSITK